MDVRNGLKPTETEFAPLKAKLETGPRLKAGDPMNPVIKIEEQAGHMPSTVKDERSVWTGPDPQTFILENLDKLRPLPDRRFAISTPSSIGNSVRTGAGRSPRPRSQSHGQRHRSR